MRTIGLVGGMTPESTVEYYQRLIRRCRERVAPADPLRNPVILIHSLDLAELVEHQRAGRAERIVELLAAILERLREAGAAVGALTANTPHLYLEAVARRTTLPLVSIVEATRDAARDAGVGRALLMGTQRTMESTMYPKAFAAADLEVVVPAEGDREFLDRVIFGELSLGQVRPEVRRRCLDICRRAVEEQAVGAVILGCTELPLVLGEGDLPVPLLDTVAIHVDAILDLALDE